MTMENHFRQRERNQSGGRALVKRHRENLYSQSLFGEYKSR